MAWNTPCQSTVLAGICRTQTQTRAVIQNWGNPFHPSNSYGLVACYSCLQGGGQVKQENTNLHISCKCTEKPTDRAIKNKICTIIMFSSKRRWYSLKFSKVLWVYGKGKEAKIILQTSRLICLLIQTKICHLQLNIFLNKSHKIKIILAKNLHGTAF